MEIEGKKKEMTRSAKNPKNTLTIVCTHIFERTRPALYVSRADGDWVVLCGDRHPDDPDQYRVVGIGHLLSDDPQLQEVLDLSPGEEAERETCDSAWLRTWADT